MACLGFAAANYCKRISFSVARCFARDSALTLSLGAWHFPQVVPQGKSISLLSLPVTGTSGKKRQEQA